MNKDELKRQTKGRFLVATNAFIFKEDKILITKRNEERDHDPGRWECVSGRFNQDFETVEDEVVREIKEELGESFHFQLIAPISFYHFYRGGNKADELVGINYLCEYLEGEIKLCDEHTAYDWVKPEDFIKRDIHELLKKDLRHLLSVKDVYFDNKDLFINNFKKSN